tara:strand:+ start:832 stop:1713 length:882 start_codon:yes stop_codon:yes gene_type:complete
MALPNLSTLELGTKSAKVGDLLDVFDSVFDLTIQIAAESNDAKTICKLVHKQVSTHKHNPAYREQIYKRGCEFLRVNLDAFWYAKPTYNTVFYDACRIATGLARGLEFKNILAYKEGPFYGTVFFVLIDEIKQDAKYGWYLVPEDYLYFRELAIVAIKQNPHVLKFMRASTLQNDREVVLAAVRQDGKMLEWASDELRKDFDVVLAAVKQNGEALQFALGELRSNRSVVLAAVKEYGEALEWASEPLKADREVVRAAAEQAGHAALEFASADLRRDESMLLIAAQCVNYDCGN